MTDAVLVINSGSSSVKFALFNAADADSAPRLLYRGAIDRIGAESQLHVQAAGDRTDDVPPPDHVPASNHKQALESLFAWMAKHAGGLRVVAAGHRIVHAGDAYAAPVRVDAEVVEKLAQYIPLAPLHQPHNLAGIEAVSAVRPGLPQVACFDTAFHLTQPPLARHFALPRDLNDAGIKRYGFHGLSYEYIARALPEFLGRGAEGKVVIAHLGNGASLCALRARKSVATTMGFTPLDGLPMGTRCGTLDPGVILYLLQERKMDAARIGDMLYHESGLLGVSGLSSDMRELLASDNPQAREAVALFVYRVGRELGSLAAALGGLDALVFTGGIGEHAAAVRAQICRDAHWLGLKLDETANDTDSRRITARDSRVSAWIIPTNEEVIIARHTIDLLGGTPR